MTSKERITALVAGQPVDPKPTIAWPNDNKDADVRVYPAGQFPVDPSVVGLAIVPNLFRRFQLLGEDPIALMKDNADPTAEAINEAEVLSRMEAQNALSNGAIGVLYELHGADTSQCTPMEYGGLFLEKDRAFLESIASAPCNMIYVNGKEPYLDFVSDLPAKVFGWDAKGSGKSVAEVRKIRSGLLAADDTDADILVSSTGSITESLEGALVHA